MITRKQRGIATGWLYLIGLILLIGTLTGLVVAWKSYTNGLITEGYERGKAEVNSVWNKREAGINADAALKIEAANKRVLDAERKGSQDVADVRTDYQLKLKGKDNALQIALNSLRDGTGKLFSHDSSTPSGTPVGGNTSSGSLSTAAGVDGTRRAELSTVDSEFLLRLGSKADTVVIKLGKAQDLIAAYYKLCGPQKP